MSPPPPLSKPDKSSARTLGSLIRDGRRKQKLSQRQLAAELPMSQTNLSRIELGDHAPPSDAVLLSIARVLELDPRELLRAAGRQAIRLAAALNADVQELLRAAGRQISGQTFEAAVLDQLGAVQRELAEVRREMAAARQALARLERGGRG